MSCEGLNDVYSIKSAVRLINKCKYPKGTVFRILLPFVGYDFYYKTKNY